MAEKSNVTNLKEVAKNINPQQAIVNGILSTGKYIIVDEHGKAAFVGIESYAQALGIISGLNLQISVDMAESMAFNYTNALKARIEKHFNIKLKEETKEEVNTNVDNKNDGAGANQ